ncbi:ATP-binding protein [Luteibacter sp. 3190]|uniref:sensor histidine kinase n=1 Tax=Luteibacter sp. 3190 TaxID=2817736 RepID=UPI0028594F06|nr:ATP-binding protein [Luteibacter sp. 3190]MDR6935902.1 signal transduction histidine kinase/ligand-binding sensor domain-containing protein [Luteibacter sp. 3190]
MREWLRGMGRAVLIAVTALLLCAAASAPDTLGSYQHTAFLKKDGAPGDVAGLVQGRDGFLWIIGTKGLTRFDGVSFTAFEPPAGERFEQAQLDRIVAAPGGGVWVTNIRTGPSLVRHGHIETFGPAQGFPGRGGRFFTARDGTVWIATPDGYRSFDEARHAWVRRLPAKDDLDMMDAAFDSDGNLWIARAGLAPVVVPEGREAPVDVAAASRDIRKIRVGRSGRMYLMGTDSVHFFRREGLSLTETALPFDFHAFGLCEDREGNVWLTSPTNGVVFISRAAMQAAEERHALPAYETMRKAEGLSGGVAWPIAEDTDGNVWIGSEGGIDRFTRSVFTQVRLPEGIHEVSAAVLKNGEVWVASETRPAIHAVPPASWQEAGIGKHGFAAFLDRHADAALIANTTGLWRADERGATPVATFAERVGVGRPACVVSDAKGRIYLCPISDTSGAVSWDGTAWNTVIPPPALPRVAAVGDDDAIWMGGVGSLWKVLDGKVTAWTTRDGLHNRAMSVIAPVRGGAWIGGESGIEFFDGHRFTTLRGSEAEAFVPTTGLFLDPAGNLWAHTLGGVARIDAASIPGALASGGKPFTYRMFDESDGVPGAPDPDRTLPTLRASADGRLWAQTTAGLAWIDPASMPVSRKPVSPVIETIATSQRRLPANEAATLDGTERSVRIAYTAPALSDGPRLHYRYRLRGLSDTWEDVSNRREAVFTNLPPGAYTFEVAAVGQDGAASERVATLRLTRNPALHETWWFRALAFLPLLGLIWLWQRIHARNLRRRLKIRADERDAVARDIHDTLLQRFHGLTLTLQAWAADDRFPAFWRKELDDMALEARDAIVEGRQRILSLRRSGDTGLALYDDLAAEGSLLQQRHAMAFVLDAKGEPRPLRPECTYELRQIALEGMRNAFTHAKGTTVSVTLNYASDALWLSIVDDGIGMPAEATGTTGAGRFGLVGLRERVARVGGVLNVDSAPGEGTELHVKIPARRAYMRAGASPAA